MNPLHVLFQEALTAAIDPDGDVEFPFAGSTVTPIEALQPDKVAYRAEFKAWFHDVWLDDQRNRLKRLLAIHGNEGRFLDLVRATKSGFLVPLVGSGMSKSSGFPLWREFLHKVREFTAIPAHEIDNMLDAGQYEEAVDRIAAGAGPHLFEERIEQTLRVNDASTVTGAVRLLPLLAPQGAATTNLDDVLEAVYLAADKRIDNVLVGARIGEYRKLAASNARVLLKIHGDCRQSDGRVLGAAEYDAAYGVGCPPREGLALLCKSKVLLWMGCSLGLDRTVRLMGEVVAADPHVPRHFAFLRLPKDGGVRLGREKSLAERKIFPIWYDDIDDDDASIMAFLVGVLDQAGLLQNVGGDL